MKGRNLLKLCFKLTVKKTARVKEAASCHPFFLSKADLYIFERINTTIIIPTEI